MKELEVWCPDHEIYAGSVDWTVGLVPGRSAGMTLRNKRNTKHDPTKGSEDKSDSKSRKKKRLWECESEIDSCNDACLNLLFLSIEVQECRQSSSSKVGSIVLGTLISKLLHYWDLSLLAAFKDPFQSRIACKYNCCWIQNCSSRNPIKE